MRAVNLIPADQRGGAPVGAGRSEGGAYAVLALLAGIAVMAVLYGKAHHEVTSRTAQAASLSARAQQAQASASQLAPYANFISLRQQRTQAVEQLVDTRFDWAHVLHEFGRVLPSDASITSISGAIGVSTTAAPAATTTATGAPAAAPVTSATPAGSVPTFSIAGCATTQEAVAQTIDRLRLIDGVSTVTLQSSAASSSPGSSTGGQCTATGPVFALTVTFDALPTPSASTVTPAATTTPAADVSGSSGTTQGSSR